MTESDDIRWLVSLEGHAVIQLAGEIMSQYDLVTATAHLRKNFTHAQTSLVLQQARLRPRARKKFCDADRLFFNEQALQQASGESLANYKALRFPGEETVHDLCCGIGGDLFSLARRGPTIGVERDPALALLAAANCQTLGLVDTRVEQRDATKISFEQMPLVHIDPDRRAHGRRTTTIAFHEPSEAFLNALLERCEGGAIKLAPATEIPVNWREETELEWISYLGECKQLVVWFGTLAGNKGSRMATALAANEQHTSVVCHGDNLQQTRAAQSLGRYVFEPDNAVIAAQLASELADREGLSFLSDDVAYLTGDLPSASPLLAAFEVIEQTPFDIKQVKAMLKRHDVGTLEIKKRGVEVQPERLRKKLAAKGQMPATLLLTPLAGRVTAILARRIRTT